MCVGHRHRTLAPRAQKTDEYICIACASLNHFAFSGSSPSHSHSHSHSHSLTRSGCSISISMWKLAFPAADDDDECMAEWVYYAAALRCLYISSFCLDDSSWFGCSDLRFAIRTARSCCSRPSSPPLLRDLSREGYDAAADDSTALQLLQTLLVRTIACGR
jgi:hypothetical protein